MTIEATASAETKPDGGASVLSAGLGVAVPPAPTFGDDA